MLSLSFIHLNSVHRLVLFLSSSGNKILRGDAILRWNFVVFRYFQDFIEIRPFFENNEENGEKTLRKSPYP